MISVCSRARTKLLWRAGPTIPEQTPLLSRADDDKCVPLRLDQTHLLSRADDDVCVLLIPLTRLLC